MPVPSTLVPESNQLLPLQPLLGPGSTLACHALPFKRCAPLILPGSSILGPFIEMQFRSSSLGLQSRLRTLPRCTARLGTGWLAHRLAPSRPSTELSSTVPAALERKSRLPSGSRQAGSSPPSRSSGCLQADPGEAGESDQKQREQNPLGIGSRTTNGGSPKHSVLRACAKHQNVAAIKPSRTHPTHGALSSHL